MDFMNRPPPQPKKQSQNTSAPAQTQNANATAATMCFKQVVPTCGALWLCKTGKRRRSSAKMENGEEWRDEPPGLRSRLCTRAAGQLWAGLFHARVLRKHVFVGMYLCWGTVYTRIMACMPSDCTSSPVSLREGILWGQKWEWGSIFLTCQEFFLKLRQRPSRKILES